MEEGYSPRYFATIGGRSRTSADIVVPLVMQILAPRSVVDIGCGTAAWAGSFKSAGVPEVLGIDGDYCDRTSLEILEDEFHAADLTNLVHLSRRYDLAVCLEVAEHLEERYASQLIESLTQAAPTVLFSAAIPHQGGERHVNEQWPPYWIDRFARRGFVPFDIFRQELWTNADVAWWYSQNLLLFVDTEHVARFPALSSYLTLGAPQSLVHPGCWLQLAWRNRVLEAVIELTQATPPKARILLADNAELGVLPPIGRSIEPFTDLDGVYNGPPVDASAAIDELARKIATGVTHIAFAWPAFWWLDHYARFAEHLRTEMTESLANERWVIFSK